MKPQLERTARRGMEALTLDAPTPITFRSSDEALVQQLEALANEIGGVRALVVGDRSGLPIVSSFRGPASMTTTAMATLAMSAATKVTSSLNLPEPDDVLIEAGGWRVLVQLLGNGFTLTCVLPAEENLGLVKLAMRARGREIREIIDEIA
jgi:predicted regulator of Ras-like GTPase activity (Roadblock/LC7/MglB family)